jgi:UDP-N-acetylglucosamine 4-epimerase
VVTATVLALRTRGIAGETFNVGTGMATSVSSLLHKLQKISGLRSIRPKYQPPRRGDIRRSVAEISRTMRKLRYKPMKDLERELRILMTRREDAPTSPKLRTS